MKTLQTLRRQFRSRRPVAAKPAHLDDNRATLSEALGYPVQAKLKVGAPDDAQEREADAVAERVMATPEAKIQRKCAQCAQEDEDRQDEEVRRKVSAGETTPASTTAGAIATSRGGGQPLAGGERAFFEPRLAIGLDHVRIHADAAAARLAQGLSARAFTVGSDVYFGSGEYRPDSDAGRRLLAHELAHVVQQGDGRTLRRVPLEGETQEPEAGPAPDATAGQDTAPDREAAPGQEAPAQEAPALEGAQPTAEQADSAQEDLPEDFCRPYRWPIQASAAHLFLNGVWIPYARGMFGATVAGMWQDYLGRAKGSSLTPRVFTEPDAIATAFKTAGASTADRDGLFNEVAAAMRTRPEANAPLPPRAGGPYTASSPYNTPRVPLRTLLPPASRVRNIEYGWGSVSIPGNLAGGIGSSDAGPDNRLVTGGEAWISRYLWQGKEMKVVFINSAAYQVNDAVDFCPGNPGGMIAQRFTIPMSRLEATSWTTTYDLPFQVNFSYDGARTL